MGEAKTNKLNEISNLIAKAKALVLEDSGLIDCWLPEELLPIYNGIGPAWLPAAIRNRITEHLAVFAPACLIHDFHFHVADGSRAEFNRVNDILERNCRRCINGATKWYQILRRAAGYYAAHLIAEACRRYGWSAYRAGMVEGIAVGEESKSKVEVEQRTVKNSIVGLGLITSTLLLLTGCYRAVELVREGEYTLSYTAVGLKTDVSKIEAEKMTNGTVRVFIEGVATDVSERNAKIVESSGTAIGNIAEKVVEGMK